MQLALYTAMRSGPVSVVFVCGQRLWRLPPQLLQCTHALLWPWNMDAVRAHVSFQSRMAICRPNPLHLSFPRHVTSCHDHHSSCSAHVLCCGHRTWMLCAHM